MSELPDAIPRDLPIVERDVVRVVVRDAVDRVLLFHTHEVSTPENGEWWELPGGGLEPGETYVDAAVRELREETGLVVAAADVGPARWRRTGVFRHRDVRQLQHELVAEVRLPGPGPAIDVSGQLDYEQEDYFGHRWWPLAEVVRDRPRCYPGRLPDLLGPFLAGEEIEEPLEVWS